jgi:hypothetical protein
MLMSESYTKKNVDDNELWRGKMADGWSVWELPDADQAEEGEMRNWKFDFGEEVKCMAMCPEDNVVAIATGL